MFVGEYPVIHLVGVENECVSVEPKIEHSAPQAKGLRELTDNLTCAGIVHTLDPVPGMPIVQVNLEDVDGNHVHIDFHSDELNMLE